MLRPSAIFRHSAARHRSNTTSTTAFRIAIELLRRASLYSNTHVDSIGRSTGSDYPVCSAETSLKAFHTGFALHGKALVVTAFPQKRRKLSPFGSINTAEHSAYDTSSPPPSPPLISAASPPSQAPSPPRESIEGLTPSGAFEHFTIDSGNSVDMSDGSGSGNTDQRPVVSPGRRVLGPRSASPAKRSAADMEGGDKSSDGGQHVPGSFTNDQQEEQTQFDEVFNQLSNGGHAMDTQDSSTMSTETAATSFTSEAPPPYTLSDSQTTLTNGDDHPSIDEQVKEVLELSNKPMDEGQRGYVVSCKWLARVQARSSHGLNDPKYPKEAREGEIGQVDNTDIVPEGAFAEPVLKDIFNQSFIPLKPGLTLHEDYEILPYDAFGRILVWYGIKQSAAKPIIRYAHDTAESDAVQQNMMYEMYPPVITVRKIPQPKEEAEEPAIQPKSSLNELRLKDERRARGQMSPDDALQLVSSRSERFNDFLKRSKEASGIPFKHKVKIWKLLDPTKISVDLPNNPQTGIPSPPESRSTSPKAARVPQSKLILSPETFDKMEVGTDLERIDAQDETNNANYNGSSTMNIYQLFEDTTIALEEMIGGPAGGEFVSDSKKVSNRLGIGKRIMGSKPGSTTTSGRTSPAPPGMMTRGRQRRDGRTRGTVGLTNLGNTCYMNSALQCIRSVEELAIYFLSGSYQQDINTNNPLGHNGQMASRYFELLKGIYAENVAGAFTPSAFKKTLGSIQPMFSGYGQQDSQEFLSFLVDALHEDLNRIQKKPYTENPDSDDKTVHDPEAIIKLGETYRANHKARNDSVAMDLFSGFYKNTMECPVCDKISITFDPYSLLTVQLPIESTFQHTVTFVPLRGKPVNHMIDMDKNASIKSLKENIASKHTGVKADKLWIAEVYSHKIYKVFENSATLSEASIQSNDFIFAFELEDVPTNFPSPADKKSAYTFTTYSRDEKAPGMQDPKGNQFAVPIFSRQKSRHGNNWEIIMHPMYILLTREEAQDFDTILKKVLIAVSRMTTRDILSEFDPERSSASAVEGDAEGASSAAQDGHVSDSSVSSENGYVEISVEKPDQVNGVQQAANSSTGRSNEEDDRPIPKNFMNSDYELSNALGNQLFELKFAPSEGGNLHCSGMSSIRDAAITNMLQRVKKPSRRASIQSSSSGAESTTSTASLTEANGEIEESETDDMGDAPDITLGGEEAIPPLVMGEDDEEQLPDDPLQGMQPRGGRRKKNRRGKNRNNKTYGGKYKHGNRQNRPNSGGSFNHLQKPLNGTSVDEDDPYYIKLGEGIVLDWYPEGLDALFGRNTDDDDDQNGSWVSTPEGKGLPYIHDPAVEEKKSRREARKKNGITLEDCFQETGKREVLSEDNAWYCNRCKELRQAHKTLEIWTIPDILVVHLKRFGGNRSFRDKIDVLVDYPIEGLDMNERIGMKEDGKEYTYDLFAVDNHYGGLGGGHYTAMAKNFYDGLWYDYNDSSCSKIGETPRHSAAAYLLFYRRRSDQPLGPQYLQDLVMEARAPPATEPAEEAGDESDSGEGKLGGPNGSSRGPSSALTGAGVVLGGGGGAGAGVNSHQTMKTNDGLGSNNGRPVYGPQRPPEMLQYGNKGDTSWNFDNLNEQAPETALMNNMDVEDNDDAASTTAVLDNTTAGGFIVDRMDEDTFDTAGQNTPAESPTEWIDDHTFYSAAHERQDEADMDSLHLEDTGTIGEYEADGPVTEIYPETVPLFSEDEHEKMD